MSRPEWLTCIRRTTDARDLSRAWCGEPVAGSGGFVGGVFCFQDIEHAIASRAGGGRLVACQACVAAVVRSLTDVGECKRKPGRPCQPDYGEPARCEWCDRVMP
jgi:hypothetical protein